MATGMARQSKAQMILFLDYALCLLSQWDHHHLYRCLPPLTQEKGNTIMDPNRCLAFMRGINLILLPLPIDLVPVIKSES